VHHPLFKGESRPKRACLATVSARTVWDTGPATTAPARSGRHEHEETDLTGIVAENMTRFTPATTDRAVATFARGCLSQRQSPANRRNRRHPRLGGQEMVAKRVDDRSTRGYSIIHGDTVCAEPTTATFDRNQLPDENCPDKLLSVRDAPDRQPCDIFNQTPLMTWHSESTKRSSVRSPPRRAAMW